MTLFTILGILLISLIVIVPLIEKFGPKASDARIGKISRWILPLVALALVLQLLAHWLK